MFDGLDINYQQDLNPQQYDVVVNADGPSLVLAGAGSGKTRVLIYRLAYILNKGISVKRIMLATFTNKAAREMIKRAEILLKQDLSSLWAGTFHHIGNLILRREAHWLGYSPNFSIIDREDAKDLMDDCIEELGFHKKGKLFPKKELIINIYGLMVNSVSKLEEVIEEYYPQIIDYIEDIRKIIIRFYLKKKESNVMDFSDLLRLWNKVLDEDAVCEKYSRMFEYILVDEYQDTNKLQFEIIKKLSKFHKNILVVGDDAQSIYSFRAADIKNILDFPKTFEGTKTFRLETNYRSTPEILDLANNIILHNKKQFQKHLCAIKESGLIPVFIRLKDVYKQAEFVAQEIINFSHQDLELSKMAVLFRSRFQALELEVELIRKNIPYIIRGGVRFFEQSHVKDILSFLRVCQNKKDEISFKRAACLYPSIGRKYAYKIWNALSSENKDYVDIIKQLPQKQSQSFKEFYGVVSALSNMESISEMINFLVKEYEDYCYVTFDNYQDRLDDLKELSKMASKYKDVKGFLEDINSYESFKGDNLLNSESSQKALVLSTIHQAKGLEWDAVFVIGLREDEFPHQKSFKSQDSLEEERRLFYVAVTRAKQYLYMLHPVRKYSYNEGLISTDPSIFVQELSNDLYRNMDFFQETDFLPFSQDQDFYL